MPSYKTTGRFANGVPFVRIGEGSRKLVILVGGPSPMPSGFGLSIYTNPYRKAMKDFTLFMLGRKENMPNGYSTRDMAADCAKAIEGEIGAPVDIVGASYGGLIAPYIAVDYPRLVDHLVFASSAYRISDQGKAVDRRFAELQGQGRRGEAYAVEITGMYPEGLKRHLFQMLARLVMSLSREKLAYPADLLVEAKAEEEHDCHDVLKDIKAPTLVIAGDRDFFCPIELLQETAALIPDARLVLIEGKGHSVVATERVGMAVLDFILK